MSAARSCSTVLESSVVAWVEDKPRIVGGTGSCGYSNTSYYTIDILSDGVPLGIVSILFYLSTYQRSESVCVGYSSTAGKYGDRQHRRHRRTRDLPTILRSTRKEKRLCIVAWLRYRSLHWLYSLHTLKLVCPIVAS